MGIYTEKVKSLIEKYLYDGYDAVAFSWELQDLIVDNYSKLRAENEMIAKRLDDVFPELCSEYERGFPVEPFKEKIKTAYESIFN